MKTAFRINTALAAALLALTLSPTVRADHGGSGGGGGKGPTSQKTRLRARLTGQAIQLITPEGHGDFRSETKGTRFKVEVEAVNLPDGTVLTVSIQSGANAPVQVGEITLSAGEGELDLESRDGDVVPAVLSGDVLSVANAGTTILAGAFGSGH
jgi:hypothetical protein